MSALRQALLKRRPIEDKGDLLLVCLVLLVAHLLLAAFVDCLLIVPLLLL